MCAPGRAGGHSAVWLLSPLRTGRRFLFSELLFLGAIDALHRQTRRKLLKKKKS